MNYSTAVLFTWILAFSFFGAFFLACNSSCNKYCNNRD